MLDRWNQIKERKAKYKIASVLMGEYEIIQEPEEKNEASGVFDM